MLVVRLAAGFSLKWWLAAQLGEVCLRRRCCEVFCTRWAVRYFYLGEGHQANRVRLGQPPAMNLA
jgi:hypothetical protein